MEQFKSILKVRSREQLLAESVSITRELGLERVSAVMVVDSHQGDSRFANVNNTPDSCREWFDDATTGRQDPVMRHCKRSSVPVVWNQPLPDDPAEISRMTADLPLFAAYAQDVALTVLVASSPHADDPGLTPRELECLRWTMEGKTAWEVGNIIGISEQTAARHLNNATQKLGCVNKLHAVVKALRLGLIS